MQLPAWERNRDKLYHYKRREPTDSPLYRILYHHREEFEYRYEELFQQQYGFLGKEVLEAFDAYLNCGVLRHGCVRAVCEHCDHSTLIAFACHAYCTSFACCVKSSVG